MFQEAQYAALTRYSQLSSNTLFSMGTIRVQCNKNQQCKECTIEDFRVQFPVELYQGDSVVKQCLVDSNHVLHKAHQEDLSVLVL